MFEMNIDRKLCTQTCHKPKRKLCGECTLTLLLSTSYYYTCILLKNSILNNKSSDKRILSIYTIKYRFIKIYNYYFFLKLLLCDFASSACGAVLLTLQSKNRFYKYIKKELWILNEEDTKLNLAIHYLKMDPALANISLAMHLI